MRTFRQHLMLEMASKEFTALEDAIEEVAEVFREEVKQGYYAHMVRLIEKVKPHPSGKGFDMSYPKSWGMGNTQYKAALQLYQKLSPYFEYGDVASTRVNDPKFLKPNWEHKLAEEAKKVAQETVSAFAYKQNAKMKEIMLAMKDKPTIRIWGSQNDNYLTFTWPDGCTFKVRNQVVSVYPMNAVPHYRFPTTFHDIVGPDGTKKKSMSVEQLTTLFKQG